MNSLMSDHLQRFQSLLYKIFRFDLSSLDFGIYRILNFKRSQIEKFINIDIPDKVNTAFAQFPQTSSINEIKSEIFSDLYNFFNRFYEDGDFIPKRRRKRNAAYLIPYNGEEVKLHWATSDMYYIKTTDIFKDYTFSVPPLKVIFKITHATQEIAFNKSINKRYFILSTSDPTPISFDPLQNTLTIHFNYTHLTNELASKYQALTTSVESDEEDQTAEENNNKKLDQRVINKEIHETILNWMKKENLTKRFVPYLENKVDEIPLLLYHLNRFTSKNSSDFFIHKNLKLFLEEQLDLFIKSEVLNIDILKSNPDLHLARIQITREIAQTIIDFLAQIEDFQRKLWEKKKFVIDTHYVITLDKIKEYAGEIFLESILDKILSNQKQLEEWRTLFDVEVKGKEDLKQGSEWKKLPIDTRYFSEDFKWRLLEALTQNNDLDDILDGVLIKSENFQALNLLLNKYREKIKTIYIDPPYNTGNDEFLYKDNYQHSSWLTMMENRLRLAKDLLREDGVIFVSIGDKNEIYRESHRLVILLDDIFVKDNWLNTFSIETANQSETIFVVRNKEYLIAYSRNKDKFLPYLKPKIQEARCTTSNYDQTQPIIEFPSGIRVEGLSDGEYSQDDFWVEESLENLTFVDNDKLIVREGKLLKAIRIKARWSNPRDLTNFFAGNKETKFGKEITEVVFRKQKKGKKLSVIAIKRGFEKPLSILKFTSIGTSELENLGFNKILLESLHPKHTSLISYFIQMGGVGIILDFFAGSGTTAHAVMKLNKEDGGKRKFILVEMADYFYTVIIPRIKKVAYSFNWREGKPQDMDGIGVFFKYHTLEQYEDTLDNLEITENKDAEFILKSDYLIKYFLNLETQNSPSLLNIEKLKSPFDYQLKFNSSEVGNSQFVKIDIPETFNYLLGVKIKKVKFRINPANKQPYLFILSEKNNSTCAIIWRNVPDLWDKPDFDSDNDFIKSEILSWNPLPIEIYINSPTTFPAQLDDYNFNLYYIEPIFKKIMMGD